MKFKIASFNCNSVRMRLGIILDWLEKHRPDALALQETKVVDELFPESDFTAAGWHVVYRGQKAYNGVAIVSKERPRNVSFGLDDGGEPDESRLIRADVRRIPIVNTYVPQGHSPDSPKFQYKLEWLRRVRDYFDRHFTPRKRLLWVGDLNCAPTPIDVYDSKQFMGHVCHCPETFRVFGEAMDWGFVDVFRKHRPDAGEYTFFDYRLPKALDRGLGWRIDHICATKPVANKSVDSYVDLEPRSKTKPSDHTFIVAEFDI